MTRLIVRVFARLPIGLNLQIFMTGAVAVINSGGYSC